MSLSFQLYALDPDELAAVLSDPDRVADYFMERYLTDTPGQAAWLDKAGMGIRRGSGVLLSRRRVSSTSPRLRPWVRAADGAARIEGE